MPVVQNVIRVAIPCVSPRRQRVCDWLAGVLFSRGGRGSAWACGLLFLLSSPVMAAGSPDRLSLLMQQQQTLQVQFAADLEAVAVTCEVPALAAEIRQLAVPLEQQPGNVDSLPTHIQAEIPATLPPAEKAARVRVRKLRSDYAQDLYLLSRKALTDQHPSFAYRLIREVLFLDPDHARARGLIGYRREGDEWTTPFVARKKKEGMVWHEEFGWLPAKNVPRYVAGERLYQGRWITREKEETLRSNFKNGWAIETEHFKVQTNHSLEQGVHLAASVEVFHRYFMREFAAFFQTRAQLDKLFKDGTGAKSGDLYEIDHFRLRTEFVQRLIQRCPNAGKINGIYMPSDRKAYFFHNPDLADEASLETLYHEVTHQLLSESSNQTIPVGNARDFWVVEGIACYFESFRVAEDGAITVGDINHPRIQAARDQVVVTKDYEPLARFTAYGLLPFQQGDLPVLQRRYAQATGLTHFFMNAQDGIYRDGFIEYLTQIYSPDQRVRDHAKTLEQILGVSYATLDTQYAAYMRGLERPTAELPKGWCPPQSGDRFIQHRGQRLDDDPAGFMEVAWQSDRELAPSDVRWGHEASDPGLTGLCPANLRTEPRLHRAFSHRLQRQLCLPHHR